MIQDYQNIISNLSLLQWALLGAFFAVFVIRFTYLVLFTGRVCLSKNEKPGHAGSKALTIVFTLRNEEENIRRNLQKILEFEDVDFEVVAVDDFSQDNSLSLLGVLNKRYPHLKISSLSQETRFSVKLAQNIALKSASTEWVLMVPPAMESPSNEWLKQMAGELGRADKNLVLAYSGVSARKGFFNLLCRIENFYQQIRSAAYVRNGIPFVYSEDNLAFKKEKYFELGGYGKNIKEPYANLELVVNSFIKKKTTQISFSKASNIYKDIDAGRPEYLDLLNKSIRIEKHLAWGKRAVLFADRLTEVLFLPLGALALGFCFELLFLLLVPFVLIFVARVLIIKITLNRLNESKIFISSLVYGLLMPYYKMIYRWRFGRASKKHKWNKVD